MMQRLGDYIRPVDVRNRDLKVERLMGINIEKKFMPSVANVIGTDLSNYKVVSKNQFACNLMHVGRDEKIPVAIQNEDDPIIVSPAYVVFEVNDAKVLDPEYLMMWFSRSEFDRNAWFYTDGDVRGGMDREALFDMTIPVPDIREQRNIVAEYKTLQTRIDTNKRLIATLEQTAQTLYRHTFVDNIDPNNLPQGWRMGTLGEVCSFKYGKLPDKHLKSDEYPYPVFSGYAVTGYADEYILENSEIVVIARGDAGSGKVCMSPPKCFLSNLAIAAIANDEQIKYYLYYHLLNSDTMSLRSGTAQAQITINNLEPFEIVIPPKELCVDFGEKVQTILNCVENYNRQNQTLTQMQTLLLSKMGA